MEEMTLLKKCRHPQRFKPEAGNEQCVGMQSSFTLSNFLLASPVGKLSWKNTGKKAWVTQSVCSASCFRIQQRRMKSFERSIGQIEIINSMFYLKHIFRISPLLFISLNYPTLSHYHFSPGPFQQISATHSIAMQAYFPTSQQSFKR